MKIAVVLPRHNRFSPDSATSIDLCAHDFVLYSRYRENTTVLCPFINDPFNDVEVEMFRTAGQTHAARAKKFVKRIQELNFDIVVVHQHLPTASAIAKALPQNIPVLFHTHNFAKPSKGWLNRTKRTRQYHQLAGIIFVSKACRVQFQEDWPSVTTPTYVVHNGLDFTDWVPEPQRESTILYAGRLAQEKGVRELADALPAAFKEFPHWNAVFICSEGDHDGYSTDVRLRLAAMDDRVKLLENKPHADVKYWYERAAIAVVPSQFDEPFGRTAIEAFAGGAALITSGTGGLKEVVGDCAITVNPCTSEALTPALCDLMQKESVRKQMSEKAWKRGILHFDVLQSASRLDDLYEQVLRDGISRR